MFLCDFHSHIMPGADHGSSGIEATEKQIEIIKESFGEVVAKILNAILLIYFLAR